MSVPVDEIDVKILRQLIRDARTKHKELAKMCGLSSTAVSKRIHKLKAQGLIIGAGFYFLLNKVGILHAVTILVENFKPGQEAEVIQKMKERTDVVVLSHSIGKDNCSFFVVARSTKEVEDLRQFLQRHTSTGRISINFWNKTSFLFENIEIDPSEA